MKKRVFVLLMALMLIVSGCSKQIDTTENNEKLQVVTSFYPIYLLAQAVTEGAEGLELKNMAQPRQVVCMIMN